MANTTLTVELTDYLDGVGLVALLIARNKYKMLEAPVETKRYGKHYEIIIGIGNDHVAYLTIDDDALKALKDYMNNGNHNS